MKGARRLGRIGWLSLFFFVVLHSSPAAGGTTVLERRFYLRGGALALDILLSAFFSERTLDAIETGMTTSIAIEFRLGTARQPRVREKTLRMRLDHDIWEGRYRVIRYTSPPDTLSTADFKAAERFCTDLKGVDLGALSRSEGEFLLQVRVGVDPISPEQQKRTRKWLDLLEKGSLLELFFSLDRSSDWTRWMEVGRFRFEDLR